ncbi:MAG: hypothetical protein DRQ42_00130 [Gammaproteobacteria bacterium]|nr:MAG: hypothetical protein DRQ42_00130 [Gammaproteobacteria bacterium]
MALWEAIPIVGDVIKAGIGLIDKAVEDKDEANKIKANLLIEWQKIDMTKFTEQLKAQRDIIVAEAQGTPLQRNWRPGLMILFGFIIFNNYVLYPYLSLLWEAAPLLETPPDLWALIKIGLGGYVVGRSGEKIMKEFKR